MEWNLIRNCNILVCTPGRLLQHMTENADFDPCNIQVCSSVSVSWPISHGFAWVCVGRRSCPDDILIHRRKVVAVCMNICCVYNIVFACILCLQILILDEADQCLSMGFAESMNYILEDLPKERQTLLFSATQTRSLFLLYLTCFAL